MIQLFLPRIGPMTVDSREDGRALRQRRLFRAKRSKHKNRQNFFVQQTMYAINIILTIYQFYCLIIIQ